MRDAARVAVTILDAQRQHALAAAAACIHGPDQLHEVSAAVELLEPRRNPAHPGEVKRPTRRESCKQGCSTNVQWGGAWMLEREAGSLTRPAGRPAQVV